MRQRDKDRAQAISEYELGRRVARALQVENGGSLTQRYVAIVGRTPHVDCDHLR